MDIHNYFDSHLIFSVPIYFRSEEQHRKYFDEKRKRYFRYQENLHKRNRWDISGKDRMRWDLDFQRFYYHVWKYTEIIGYIEFRKKENSIFTFVCLPEAERFAPLMNKKRFIISDKFPDYEIELEDKSNEQVVEQIYIVIKNINKSSRRFQKYHIYNREIHNYIHLIDYHADQPPT